MRFSRRLPRIPRVEAMLVAAVLAMSGAPLWAQNGNRGPDRIPPAVIVAESLTQQQRQDIDAYVTHWAQLLQSQDDQQVTRARLHLREPLGVQGEASQNFLDYYNTVLSEALRPAVENERLIIRLNAMIVTDRLTREQALPLMIQGLQDDSAAVRYWASKAVRSIAAGGNLTIAQKLELLEQLKNLLGRENAAPVVEQLMLAIAELNLPQANRELLEALNGRVDQHLNDPSQPMQAEHAALQQLFNQSIRDAASNQVADAVIRQLAQVAVRYAELCTMQLDGNNLNNNRQEEYRQMVKLCDAILRVVHQTMGSSQAAPAEIDNALRISDWAFIQVQIEQWKSLLTQPPFSLQREDLALDTNPGADAEN